MVFSPYFILLFVCFKLLFYDDGCALSSFSHIPFALATAEFLISTVFFFFLLGKTDNQYILFVAGGTVLLLLFVILITTIIVISYNRCVLQLILNLVYPE